MLLLWIINIATTLQFQDEMPYEVFARQKCSSQNLFDLNAEIINTR